MKQTLTYQPHSFGTHACRLRVEGLPDVSSGQGASAVGIITGWTLDWVGHPQLEGRRDHLQALMATVLPYARDLLSGLSRPTGGEEDSVVIGPDPRGGHHMRLRSGEPDTPPLDLHLDDAELADLVRVLDQCRLDPRLQLPLPVPQPQPLPARELRHRVPLSRRIAAPLGGLAALAVAAGLTSLVPTPRPTAGGSPATATKPAAAPPRPAAPPAAPPKAAPTSPATTAASTPAATNSTATAPSPATATSKEARLSLLRRWLVARQPANGTGTPAQAWQLAVNGRGEVVAATPVDGNDGRDRAKLGLPAAEVPRSPAGDALLVRGDVQPSGFWELAPWHGW
ncbi:MAG: DUF4335 domain-containing protein [Cyanobacteriota bacterium]|nr:DUF4335 domain-containing protein [Cyanobacteriota bacterium]